MDDLIVWCVLLVLGGAAVQILFQVNSVVAVLSVLCLALLCWGVAMLFKRFAKGTHLERIEHVLPPEFKGTVCHKTIHPQLHIRGWLHEHEPNTFGVGMLEDQDAFLVLLFRGHCPHLERLHVELYDSERYRSYPNHEEAWTRLEDDTLLTVRDVGEEDKPGLSMTLTSSLFFEFFVGLAHMPEQDLYNLSIHRGKLTLMTTYTGALTHQTPEHVTQIRDQLQELKRSFERTLDLPTVLERLVPLCLDDTTFYPQCALDDMTLYLMAHHPTHPATHRLWDHLFDVLDDEDLLTLLPLHDGPTPSAVHKESLKAFASRLSNKRLLKITKAARLKSAISLCFRLMHDRGMHNLGAYDLGPDKNAQCVRFMLQNNFLQAIERPVFWTMMEHLTSERREACLLEEVFPYIDEAMDTPEQTQGMDVCVEHLPKRDLFKLIHDLHEHPQTPQTSRHLQTCWMILTGKGLNGFDDVQLSPTQHLAFAHHVLTHDSMLPLLEDDLRAFLGQLDDPLRIKLMDKVELSASHTTWPMLLLDTFPLKPSDTLLWKHVLLLVDVLRSNPSHDACIELETHVVHCLNQLVPWHEAQTEPLIELLAKVGSSITWEAMETWLTKHHLRAHRGALRDARKALALRIKSSQSHRAGQLSITQESKSGGLSQAQPVGAISATEDT